MSEHIVASFDDELANLNRFIAEMGGMIEQLVAESSAALVRRDTAVARKVIDEDKRVDDLQKQVEEAAITMIAKRQPMAQDLREIVAAIRIAGDMERMGDLAKNNAKRVIAIDTELGGRQMVVGIEHLSELCQRQLKAVLDAFARRDLDAALSAWARDEEIDALYTSLFRELLTYMMEDPRNITSCTHLLFCAKNLERIGDHVTNVAETLHYLITGDVLDEERPKKDTTSLTAVRYNESGPKDPSA